MNERTKDFSVIGMSCEHCRSSVQEEVAAVEGVDRVAVDLTSGQLTVSGEGFSDEAITAAVEEAGYGLAEDR